MGDKTGIQWTDSTWNCVTGCTKVSPGCDHCLLPETRVLRADMTWAPIEDIQVGDRLVAFTESPAVGQNRVWEEAVVEATWAVEKPTVEVELADGATFTASEDHRWLIAQRGASAWWRTTIGLNFKTSVRAIRCTPAAVGSTDYCAGYIAGATAGDGTFRWDPAWRSDKLGDPQSYWRVAKPVSDRIVLERLVAYLLDFGIEVEVRPFDSGASAFTANPAPMAKVETRKLANMPLIAQMCEERDSPGWMAGWLAGMFDTDASYSGGSLRFCQAKPNDVLDRVTRYAKELGFDVQPERFENAACPTARLMGGIAENIGFLATISPALTRRCRDFYGKRLETPASRVTGIRRGPVRRLIDITTSTGTFIAEGALTHNCYAETFAERWRGVPGHHFEQGFDVRLWPERLSIPLRWKRPRRIFVNSMSDVFHEAVPDNFIARMWAVMATTPEHTYQVLTKRHGRMRSLLLRGTLGTEGFPDMVEEAMAEFSHASLDEWPLRNVWLGVSAEDQHWADIRIPALLETPAAVRFVSAEPLLGPVDLTYLAGVDGLRKDWTGGPGGGTGAPHPLLDWVIAGGESGPGARRCDLAWLRSLQHQCAADEVPFFCKQLGSALGREFGAGSHGADWDAWPADLRVREFPASVTAVPA